MSQSREDVDQGETCMCGHGCVGISVPPASVCYEPKAALKDEALHLNEILIDAINTDEP